MPSRARADASKAKPAACATVSTPSRPTCSLNGPPEAADDGGTGTPFDITHRGHGTVLVPATVRAPHGVSGAHVYGVS